MNWNDPEERLALIERVGADEYSRLLKAHHAASVVTVVNGHDIRRVYSGRFGRLFAVGKTNRAFRSIPEASRFARETPA